MINSESPRDSRKNVDLQEKDGVTLYLFGEYLQLLNDALSHHFMYTLSEGDQLYDKGIKIYERLDPITEAGVLAITRLLIGSNEDITFKKVINILKRQSRGNAYHQVMLNDFKKRFNEIWNPNSELFERFWYLGSLHMGLFDPRYAEHVNAMRSCAGPIGISTLYSSIEELSIVMTELRLSFSGHFAEIN